MMIFSKLADQLIAEFKSNREEKSAKNKANNALHALTSGVYFDGLPIKEIKDILKANGFDTEPMDGIYTGRDGKLHEQVGPQTWIAMTWHRMDNTGRYEIVVYVS